MRRLLALVAVCLAAASSCTLQTATAPTGDLSLVATFEDAQSLTSGHNVQVANVVVGSVRKIELDGYRARVTMSILNKHPIPQGTTALLKRTSLLGEHFVQLNFPPNFDPETGPFIEEGPEGFALIDETSEQADFEQLAEQAAEVISAITADDIASVIDTGATGIGGRGPKLNQVISQLAHVSGVLAGQRANLAAAVDGLGQLGASLAPAAEQIGVLIDELAVATGTLADNRDRIITTLGDLTRLATLANDVILEPHGERLSNLIAQAAPVLQILADNKGNLEGLISGLLRFTERIGLAIHEDPGELLMSIWLFAPALLGPSAMTTESTDPVQGLVDLVGPTS